MARVPYLEREQVGKEAQALYDSFTTQFRVNRVPNVVKALSNSPKLASRVFPLANYFMNESTLDPRVRELAVLILMKRLDCEYGFARHIDIAQRTGISREQIDNISAYDKSSLFSADDQLILRYADDLTVKGRVDDDLYARVQALIGKESILELTAATAFWNMMARNLNALQVELEPEGR
ncbi:MAG: carboxymuconolactone decarboxylase family protein [Candidatus Binatia bacterium]